MRALAVLALAVAAVPAHADDPPRDVTAEGLTAKELRKYIQPYVPGIRDCYVQKARSGNGSLRLELVIHRDGSVFKFAFTAGGLPSRARLELDRCLRPLSETWHFPVRRGFTSAIIPFFFLQTRAPGSGPTIGSNR